mgnify:FL=1
MKIVDFDSWRKRYDEMTFDEHAEFYRRLHGDHPDQQHFSVESAHSFFGCIDGAKSVIELGGYDGGLASACLSEHPEILSWTNFDLDTAASLCDDPRYSAITLTTQFWEARPPLSDNEIFVASHVIEHLSDDDFLSLLSNVSWASAIYFDAPIDQSVRSEWDGSTAAHKLSLSWDDIDGLVSLLGYDRIDVLGPAHCYRLTYA